MDNLPSDFSYLKIQHIDENVVFRVKEIKDQKTAMNWLEKYKENTFTTWRKSKTYPKSGRHNIYKVDLHCGHFTDRRARGQRSSKHTGCLAKVQILVKRYVAISRAKKKDPLIEEWPTVINIKGPHNHSLNSTAVLKYRDMCPETKEKLCTLFRQGHGPSSALLCLKTDLLLETGDRYCKVAADGFYVPSLSIAHKLYIKELKTKSGEVSGQNMLENLKIQLQSYSTSTNGVAKLCATSDEEHNFVVICTPIMIRVHEKACEASELVQLDAYGGMDKNRHRVYFFTTPTAVGGLPLGVIITDCEQESVFYEALSKLKSLFPKDSFYKKQFPETFLIDNDLKERDALQKHFPLSKLLICHFHMLKAVWSWLSNKKHNVKYSDRLELYYLFKQVLYAKTEEDLQSINNTLILSTKIDLHPNFMNFYKKLWERKEDWALCYRLNPQLSNNTTNCVEIFFRIMKDCILDRILAFTLPQLVDYVLSRYETFIEKRLTDFYNGQSPKSLMINMLAKKGTDSVRDIRQVSGSDGTYTAISIENGIEYTIDIIGGVCSCFNEQRRKLCKHSAAILLNIGDEVNSLFRTASTKTKEAMFHIATGSQPQDWFLPLNFYPSVNISQENEIVECDMEDLLKTIAAEDCQQDLSQEKLSLTTQEEEEFKNLICRIKNGIEEKPNVFVPAVQNMLKNTKKFAATEAGLVSALNAFGTYCG